MATTVTYRPPSALEWRRLATGPEIRAALLAEAARAEGIAVGISPRRTGQYSSSFRITEATVLLAGRWRAAARLENTAPYAATVEVQDGHRVLGRTLASLKEA